MTMKQWAANSNAMTRPHEAVTFQARQVRDLKQLVARGEGESLEFKRKAATPDKIVREMIAFANAGGGHLLVGISDDGEITGLKHPEDDCLRHSTIAAELLSPAPRYGNIHSARQRAARHPLSYRRKPEQATLFRARR